MDKIEMDEVWSKLCGIDAALSLILDNLVNDQAFAKEHEREKGWFQGRMDQYVSVLWLVYDALHALTKQTEEATA